MIPTATIETLADCFRSLSALGHELSAQDWKLPTDLPGWTVQDTLAHLVGVERMMEGLTPTTHRSDPRDYVRNPIGEANEHEVDSRRPLPGAEVLAEWDEITTQRLASLRVGDDEYFAQPMLTPTGPGTLADFLSIRVLDCWLHEQDMRRAVGRPGNLAGAAAEHTVDRLARTIPIVVGKRAQTPEGGAVVIDVTGGVTRHLVCEVRAGRAGFVENASNPPLTTISLDTEAFVQLAAGRTTADAVAAAVVGDAALGRRVLEQFNMMI